MPLANTPQAEQSGLAVKLLWRRFCTLRAVTARAQLTGLLLLAFAGGVAGCGTEASEGDSLNPSAIATGKADGSAFRECELDAVVRFVNDAGADVDALRTAGVPLEAAEAIADRRLGPDRTADTGDDEEFTSAEEIDALPSVGSAALRALVAAAPNDCPLPSDSPFDVVFSPQPTRATSHLAAAEKLIRNAAFSVDVAMYSFSDSGIRKALEDAAARGVRVRVVSQDAADEKSKPAGTVGAALEDAGIDVRYVNKIMHHKFVLVDAPDEGLASVEAALRSNDGTERDPWLATGSGNWSSASATRYDENTLVVHGHGELLERFRAEFALLWNHSRDFVWDDGLVFEPAAESEPDIAEDDASIDAAFTSANFTLSESATYGWTFKVVRGTNTVANALVALIESAQTSIHIASGHLRSRPVAEALMRKLEAEPEIDLRILTDGQEYIGKTTHFEQMEELEICLGAAEGSEAKEDACSDNNFYFGYLLDQAGIGLRYKYYAYRWDYSYADQMHHKFFVVDGTRIATGSYNLSDNAEHNTLENMVFLHDDVAPGIAARYEAEFERLWSLGEQADLYRKYMDNVENGSGPLPIVFEPMALEWAQIADLKRAVVTACPDVNSPEFRTEPEKHQTCYR